MRRPAEALKRVLGQLDLRTALVTGAAGLLFSCVTTTSGVIWTRYNAAEDVRRQTAQNTADITAMRAEVQRMSAIMERAVAASDDVRRAVDDLKTDLDRRPRRR